MNEPTIFKFEQNDVRTITDEHGEPWFVAKDVCEVLEIERTDSALRNLDDDEKGTRKMSTLGGAQQVSIISESGLYRLIASSKLPEAERFGKTKHGF